MDVVNKTIAGKLSLHIPEESTAILISKVDGKYVYTVYPSEDISKTTNSTFLLASALIDVAEEHMDLIIEKLGSNEHMDTTK